MKKVTVLLTALFREILGMVLLNWQHQLSSVITGPPAVDGFPHLLFKLEQLFRYHRRTVVPAKESASDCLAIGLFVLCLS